jgi:hypothetical protein
MLKQKHSEIVTAVLNMCRFFSLSPAPKQQCYDCLHIINIVRTSKVIERFKAPWMSYVGHTRYYTITVWEICKSVFLYLQRPVTKQTKDGCIVTVLWLPVQRKLGGSVSDWKFWGQSLEMIFDVQWKGCEWSKELWLPRLLMKRFSLHLSLNIFEVQQF